MLTAVLMNRRPEAEFIFVAPTIEIAGISFRQARGMIRAAPKLLEVFQIRDNFRTILHRVTQASLKILAMDADIITGTKATGILIDETHVFSTKPHANDLFLEMRGAQAARPDGFMLQISTQSKAPPAGVFKSELQRARDVRDGKLELPRKLLPILYELPPRLGRRLGERRILAAGQSQPWPFGRYRISALVADRCQAQGAGRDGAVRIAAFQCRDRAIAARRSLGRQRILGQADR